MRPWAPICALAALAGCFDPAYTDATRCDPLGACPTGRSCVDGRCLPAGVVVDAAVDATATVDAPADAGIDAREAPAGPHLRVEKSGDGKGTVRITTGGTLVCDESCELDFHAAPNGTALVLGVFPSPGSTFTGWSGACTGPGRGCGVTIDGTTIVRATFVKTSNNLVFVTTAGVQGDFGSTEAADAMCAVDANAAGLTGNFVALVVEGSSDARDRLRHPATQAEARGFVRMDGLPVADTVSDLVTEGHVWYPPIFTAIGNRYEGYIWTGLTAGGLGDPTSQCDGWATLAAPGKGAAGLASGGPLLVHYDVRACESPFPFLCVMVDKNDPVVPFIGIGKRIFVTTGNHVPGTGIDGARALCRAEAGIQTVEPMLATSTLPASKALVVSRTYIRPDGIRLGTGADLRDSDLTTGLWVTWSGAYSTSRLVRTGSPTVATQVDLPSTCNDWIQPTTGSAQVGSPSAHRLYWWAAPSGPQTCANAYPIYCVEQ